MQLFHQLLPAEQILTDPSECLAYSFDNSNYQHAPECVLLPNSAEQIASIVKICFEHNIAITVRGRGTATTGAAVPITGGVVLSTEQFNKIVKVEPENRLLIAEVGCTNAEIQQAAAAHGFFWAPDPTSSAYCSLGGNLGTNAGGPRAIKYGTTRDNTLGLTIVTGTGDILTTGGRTTKCSTGYDLTRFIIGSEGTLGIITQATLKLIPQPECVSTLRAIYKNTQSACDAVASIMASSITPACLEFMDRHAIEMIKSYSPEVTFPEKAGAVLLINLDGYQLAMPTQLDLLATAARNTGLLEICHADSDEEIASLWRMRKALSPALKHVAPKKINEDVAVPVAAVPDLLDGIEALSILHNIKIVNFGHAGNGNIHVNLMIDPSNQQQNQQADSCLQALFNLVLKLGGTLSGEHGTGLAKRQFLQQEFSDYSLQLMADLKKVLDPKGILNPGKLPV